MISGSVEVSDKEFVLSLLLRVVWIWRKWKSSRLGVHDTGGMWTTCIRILVSRLIGENVDLPSPLINLMNSSLDLDILSKAIKSSAVNFGWCFCATRSSLLTWTMSYKHQSLVAFQSSKNSEFLTGRPMRRSWAWSDNFLIRHAFTQARSWHLTLLVFSTNSRSLTSPSNLSIKRLHKF